MSSVDAEGALFHTTGNNLTEGVGFSRDLRHSRARTTGISHDEPCCFHLSTDRGFSGG